MFGHQFAILGRCATLVRVTALLIERRAVGDHPQRFHESGKLQYIKAEKASFDRLRSLSA
jgi:hypothetical protein